jgi:hypothetical protein
LNCYNNIRKNFDNTKNKKEEKMELKNTTVIEDKTTAQEDFKSAMDEEKVVYMVVLGDDDTAERVAKEADRGAERDRKVIWIKGKTLLANEIKGLEAGAADISDEDLSEVVAFSVSSAKKVMYIIKNTDDVLELRVENGFLKAEAEQEW